ncbi:hypothetical protein CBR_g6721 [Chara braunii]|uniref:DUF659 domain-containing protein n=1 Tax=Chara braunii TaxID=69332 RepID=A0A388KKM0_CHABU|nr:hypothetical protein CBR_g6721 [Chara braunii]|eukprot:GBG70595.1 hypothetical protein CBR_g6721 [Chara braunii]
MVHHAHGTAHPDPSHAPADARHSASVPRFGEQVDHGVPAEEVPAPVSDSSSTPVPTTTGGGRSAPQPSPVLTGTLDPLQRIRDLAVAQSATPVSPGGLLDAGVLGGRATTGRCRGTYRQQAVTSYYSDPLERAWYLQIMRFIVESGMPFNSTKLESFKRMFTMIIPPGVPGAPAPRLPSYHMLRTTLLDELDGEVQKCVRPVLDTSRETSCTIMTDGWTNIRGQTLCNYLVGTEIGVVYVSPDVMRGKKDASALANAWLKRVKSMDVQLSDITAFVTDSAGVNVAAMEVFQEDESVKHIFWIPCVAHIMDLILEDIGGIDWVASRISQARLVTRTLLTTGVTIALIKQEAEVSDYSGMIGRWATVLQSMDFDIRHRKHERHGNADELTRLHRPEKVPKSEEPGRRQLIAQELIAPIVQFADDLSPDIYSQSDDNLAPYIFKRSLDPYLQWTACLEKPRDEDTLPLRQEYLKPYDIIPRAFYPRAEELVIDYDGEEDEDEETSEEGSYSEHSEGELSKGEEEEEKVGSEWEALLEEAMRTGTEAENPEVARRREEIATGKRQLEFASEASQRIGNDLTRDPEPPKTEDGDPANATSTLHGSDATW